MEVTWKLLDGINHLAFITSDLDRLIAFYQPVFDAQVTQDPEEEGLRHVFVEVEPNTVLHAFRIPGIQPPGPLPMFQRGRLDHFALNATSEEAFHELHRRVMDEGRDDKVAIKLT